MKLTKILNYKLILLSLFFGSVTSWLIKEDVTFLLFGKNFDARSELVKIEILISITISTSFIILCLLAILGSFLLRKFERAYRKIYSSVDINITSKRSLTYFVVLIFIIVLVEVLVFNQRFVFSRLLLLEERHYSTYSGSLYQFNIENGKLVAQNNDPNITLNEINIPVYYISIKCKNSVSGASGQIFYRNKNEVFNQTSSIHYDVSLSDKTFSLPQIQPVYSLRFDLTNVPHDIITCSEFVINPRVPFKLNQARLTVYAGLLLLSLFYIFINIKSVWVRLVGYAGLFLTAIKPIRYILQKLRSGFVEKFGIKRVIQFSYYILLLLFNVAVCILINNQRNSNKVTLFFGGLLFITIVLFYLGDRYLFEIEVSSSSEHLMQDAILISLTIWIVYIWSHTPSITFALLPIVTLIGRKFLHISWKRIIYSLLVIQIFAAVAGFPQSEISNLISLRIGTEGDFFHFYYMTDGTLQPGLPNSGDQYDASNNVWLTHPEYFQNQTIQTNEDLCVNEDQNFCLYVFRNFKINFDETKNYKLSEKDRSKYLAKEGFYVPTTNGGWHLITENWSSDGVIEYYYYTDGGNIELFFVPAAVKGVTKYPRSEGFISNYADMIFVLLLTLSGLLLSWVFKNEVPFKVFGLSSFLWGSALWIVIIFVCFVFNVIIKIWALPIFIIINLDLGIWIWKRRIILSKDEIKTFVFSILINCALAFVFQYFSPVLFTFDSWYFYQKIANFMVNDQFGSIMPELLKVVGFSINGLQTGAALLGKYYLPSVIPLLFVSLLIFANLAVFANFKHNPPIKRYVLTAVLVNLSFILLPMVLAFNFYLHTNLITGIYLCAAVTCFTFYRNDKSSDISALAIFGGLSFFAFTVSRVENGFIGAVIGMLIFLRGRHVSKKISAISILTSMLMILYIIKLLEYTPYKNESYLIIFAHIILVLFNTIVFIFEKTSPLLDKILDNFPRIFFIAALVLVGVYLVIIDFEMVITNLQTFILNGHLRGYFGMFWTLGIASIVILFFVQEDKLKWTNLFILVFCGEALLYFLVFTNLGTYPNTELFGSPTRSVIHYMFLLLPYLLTNYFAMLKATD